MLIPGIGPKAATSLLMFFKQKSNRELLTTLQNYGVAKVSKILPKPAETSIYNGKKIVITGTFSQPRKILIAKLEELGADIMAEISPRTDYLFVGENPGRKLNRAQALRTPIITADDEKFPL